MSAVLGCNHFYAEIGSFYTNLCFFLYQKLLFLHQMLQFRKHFFLNRAKKRKKLV